MTRTDRKMANSYFCDLSWFPVSTILINLPKAHTWLKESNCNLMSLSDSIVFYYYNKNHTRVSVANYFFLLYFFLWFSLMHYNDLIYKFLLLWDICFNFQLFKKLSLIKFLLLSYLGFFGWITGLFQLNSWRNIAGSKHILVSFFFCTFFFDFH